MHGILNKLDMMERWKTYKILSLVLLVFTDLKLELLEDFIHRLKQVLEYIRQILKRIKK